MPKTCESAEKYSRTSSKHWEGVDAKEIPQGWIDDMVKRLFDVLNRAMIRLEAAQLAESDKKGPDNKPAPIDLEATAKQSHLAQEMQRTLERLSEMELKRKKRSHKVTCSDDEIRRELKRRIDQIIATEAAGKNLPKTEQA